MNKKFLLISLVAGLMLVGFSCDLDQPKDIDDSNDQSQNSTELNKTKKSLEKDTSGNAMKNAKQIATNYFELSYKDASYVQHDNSGHEPGYYLSTEPRNIASLASCVSSEPDDIKYLGSRGSEIKAEIEFDAGYGEYPDYDYHTTWRIYLEFENGDWKIKEIKCL